MKIGICMGLDGLAGPVAGLDYIEPAVGALLCPKDGEAAFEAVAAKAAAAAAPPEAPRPRRSTASFQAI
jgi:hypothetical protein